GALAGLCLALVFLADVRWAFYAAVLGAAFWVSALPPFAPRRGHHAGLPAAFAFALIFLSLSAILAIPLGQFILHSSRSALTLADAAAFSLPPFYLIGLLIPDLGGFHEWMTYLGVIPLLLAFVGMRRRTAFWIGAVFIAAAFSLGSNFSLFPTLFRWLPGLGFLRVPPRAWFIVALGICILAAHGAQVLIEEIVPHLARRYSRISPPPYSHTPIPPHRFFLPALVIFTLADLLRVDSTLFEARPLPPRAPAAEWIAAQPGLFRVYSPSYSLPAGDGLQHVDGIDPLQLAQAVKFIEAASGVHAHGYSVTVPAFEARTASASEANAVDVATANADAIPDARQLGLLNVKYVAAEFPLDVPELKWVQTPAGGRTRVYENTLVRPRAWLADEPALPQGNRPEGRSRSAAAGDRAEVVEWSPNRIRVRGVGPGLLVLSEVVYPGWQARVDGVLTPIEPVEELLRGVRVGEGKHEVVFEFRSRALYLGAAITALGLIALAGIWGWGR
ncbi:MAG: hypothetical protein HY784_19510, partial [Chloroflexi bacterium]|nr:hypothetical protein [Chloroflexota bacterium]